MQNKHTDISLTMLPTTHAYSLAGSSYELNEATTRNEHRDPSSQCARLKKEIHWVLGAQWILNAFIRKLCSSKIVENTNIMAGLSQQEVEEFQR